MAVCLRLAAGGTVEGLGEAAVRTLAKLDQVLPGRLRAQVEAIHEATVTLDSGVERVDAATLLLLARACRETERVTFAYAGPRGSGDRRVEPYRLVATGRRWYLFAYDLDRDDWRIFRLDRMTDAQSRGWRFTPSARLPTPPSTCSAPSPAGAYDHVARVRIEAPKSLVEKQVPASVGTVTAEGPDRCIFEAGGNHLGRWRCTSGRCRGR